MKSSYRLKYRIPKLTKRERVHLRLRKKGYSESEIDDMESAAADIKVHERIGRGEL